MTAARLARRLRRGGEGLLSLLRKGAALGLLILGFVLLGSGLHRRLEGGGLASALFCAATLILLLHKMDRRLKRSLIAAPQEPLREELEAGAALVLATFALLQVTGGTSSPLHPLVYALAPFLVSQFRGPVALLLLALVVLGEVLLFFSDGLLFLASSRLLLRGAFLALFSTLHVLFFRGALFAQRRAFARELLAEVARQKREAAEFRLLPVQAPGQEKGRAAAEDLSARGAAVLVHQSLRSMVALLKQALSLHSAALYWYDGALHLKEGTSNGPTLANEVAADAGVLGTVVKGRAPLRLSTPKGGHLSYYADEATDIGAVLAVPIIERREGTDGAEGGRLVGVLLGDRRGAGAFSDEDEALFVAAAEQLLRGLQAERVFTQVERSRHEHERLYRASEQLNRALTPEQVHATAFAAAAEICAVDFAALTGFDGALRCHSVVAARGEEGLGQPLVGLSFSDNAGLVAMAVKNRHALPQDGSLRAERSPVFDDKVLLRGIESLLVLPLVSGGEVVGTLVLGTRRPHAFSKDQRAMLAILANQVAVSLENARMYKAMEAMATTDGLTGLSNRRAFNERFEDMLRRAERQGKSLTLLLSDIDHFKRVNDSYGHPVGDAVLKRVAQVVQSCMRKIDMAARYGGEEFAVVLEMTDQGGARQLAERVRKEVQGLCFHSEKGPFQCSLSLGMATFPQDGQDAKTLIAHADQALYFAKHNGRNQAVCFEDMRTPRRAAG